MKVTEVYERFAGRLNLAVDNLTSEQKAQAVIDWILSNEGDVQFESAIDRTAARIQSLDGKTIHELTRAEMVAFYEKMGRR